MGELSRIEGHQAARELANPAHRFRLATDVAEVCKQIVVETSTEIQGQKHIRVEGWQAIATAHGCAISATNVEKIKGGYRAIGQVRRVNDGVILAEAEGFVGDDEHQWNRKPEYARRAMAQTRAMSRAGRSAFAHVVVLMNAGLSTTPAEEMNFQNAPDKDAHPPQLQTPAVPTRIAQDSAIPQSEDEHPLITELKEALKALRQINDREEAFTQWQSIDDEWRRCELDGDIDKATYDRGKDGIDKNYAHLEAKHNPEASNA